MNPTDISTIVSQKFGELLFQLCRAEGIIAALQKENDDFRAALAKHAIEDAQPPLQQKHD